MLMTFAAIIWNILDEIAVEFEDEVGVNSDGFCWTKCLRVNFKEYIVKANFLPGDSGCIKKTTSLNQQ